LPFQRVFFIYWGHLLSELFKSFNGDGYIRANTGAGSAAGAFTHVRYLGRIIAFVICFRAAETDDFDRASCGAKLAAFANLSVNDDFPCHLFSPFLNLKIVL